MKNSKKDKNFNLNVDSNMKKKLPKHSIENNNNKGVLKSDDIKQKKKIIATKIRRFAKGFKIPEDNAKKVRKAKG